MLDTVDTGSRVAVGVGCSPDFVAELAIVAAQGAGRGRPVSNRIAGDRNRSRIAIAGDLAVCAQHKERIRAAHGLEREIVICRYRAL